MLRIADLRCNHEKTPYGITGSPVFSWKLISDENDTMQIAYSIIIKKEDKE